MDKFSKSESVAVAPFASQSAQYLLSSSLSSLDRMAWCCSFSFWAFSLSDRVVIFVPLSRLYIITKSPALISGQSKQASEKRP